MATTPTGLIQIEMTEYRESEMEQYIYFWVEGSNTVSPIFEDKEDALRWGKDIMESVRNACKNWEL